MSRAGSPEAEPVSGIPSQTMDWGGSEEAGDEGAEEERGASYISKSSLLGASRPTGNSRLDLGWCTPTSWTGEELRNGTPETCVNFLANVTPIELTI